jgi:hypothetical protein
MKSWVEVPFVEAVDDWIQIVLLQQNNRCGVLNQWQHERTVTC